MAFGSTHEGSLWSAEPLALPVTSGRLSDKPLFRERFIPFLGSTMSPSRSHRGRKTRPAHQLQSKDQLSTVQNRYHMFLPLRLSRKVI